MTEDVAKMTAGWRAMVCPCGMGGCNSWMVNPVAAVQGVGFTEEEAKVVAASGALASALLDARRALRSSLRDKGESTLNHPLLEVMDAALTEAGLEQRP